MIEDIITFTNIHISSVQDNYQRERYAKLTTKDEIFALFGLLLLSGVKKQSHTNVQEIWETDGTGLEIFRACMSMKRFLFLLQSIIFDNSADRPQRQASIFDRFVEQCKKNYCVGELMTIDEMLIPYRGRCSFIHSQ